MMADYGLTGILNKDMNEYPKLERGPIPFPYRKKDYRFKTDSKKNLNG